MKHTNRSKHGNYNAGARHAQRTGVFANLNFNLSAVLSSPHKVIAALAVAAVLFSYAGYFTNFVIPSRAADIPAADSWDESWSNEENMGFGKLGKTYEGINCNYVYFKDFISHLGTSEFDKYMNAGSFDPTKYTIVIEDEQDLRNWSRHCYDGDAATRRMFLSGYYVLGDNITYTQADNGIVPIGVRGNEMPDEKFTGRFDGQGFEITNLALSKLETDYLYEAAGVPTMIGNVYFAMFANIAQNAVVENLGLRSPSYDQISTMLYAQTHFAAGIAGRNEGTVRYCFVVSDDARHMVSNSSTVGGVVHTNAPTGVINNVYYAGGIRYSSPAALRYNPVVLINNSSAPITEAYYDSTVYDDTAGITAISGVSGVTTAVLKARTGILGSANDINSLWYTDSYTRHVTAYPAGYPKLCGFKVNNNVNNDTTNPYYLMRPADLIFFRNVVANAAYANFVSGSRHFRMYNCLNMSGVSRYAYSTPEQNFRGYFEGSVEGGGTCNCGTDHPGSGMQRKGHSIINLSIRKISYIGTYASMSLLYSSITSTTYVKDINFVGGDIVVPPQSLESVGTYIYVIGAVASYGSYYRISNVHTSMDISMETTPTNRYIGRYYIGGLLGVFNASTVMTNCSNSGDVTGAVYDYAYGTTASVYSDSIGGIFGGCFAGSSTTIWDGLVNYGQVTGISVSNFSSSSVPSTTCVGGVGGYSMLYARRVVNYGDVYSFKAGTKSKYTYYIGGAIARPMYGIYARDPNRTPDYITNKGNVYMYALSAENTNTIYGSGVLGPSYSYGVNYCYKGVSNHGDLYIDPDIYSLSVAGISVSTHSFEDCFNKGRFLSIDGTSPIVFSGSSKGYLIFGGVQATYGSMGTGDYTANCVWNSYNYTDISVDLKDVPSCTMLRVTGVTARISAEDCANLGNISINAENISSTNLYVSGVSGADSNGNNELYNCTNEGDVTLTAKNAGTSVNLYAGGINSRYAGSTVGCVNNGKVTLDTLNHAGTAYVAGINILNKTDGETKNCVNNGDIVVSKKAVTRTASTGNSTYITGINANSNTSAYAITDCVNNGDMYLDVNYDTKEVVNRYLTETVYISGVVHLANSLLRCQNNGDIILAPTEEISVYRLHASGIAYSTAMTNVGNSMEDCVNTGDIKNINNIFEYYHTATSERTLSFSGIVHEASAVSARCINKGNITITGSSSKNIPGVVNLYISGVASTAGNADNNKSVDKIGFKNLSNTGNLTFTHSSSVMSTSIRTRISGVIGYLGVGNNAETVQIPYIPAQNLVNGGKITVNILNGHRSLTSTNLYSNNYNLLVAGISAQPARGTLNEYTQVPMNDCANLGDIDVRLTGMTDSSWISYAVGGIAAHSGYGATGNLAAKQLLVLTDCVNGGNISVNANVPTVNDYYWSRANSGVGGILGVGYYYDSDPSDLSDTTDYSNIYPRVSNCINFGHISGGALTGGIVGAHGRAITDVLNFGTVTSAANGYAGGIMGGMMRKYYTNAASHAIGSSLYLDGAINYGVVNGSGTGGGIIGIMEQSQNNMRIFRNLLNASNAKADADTTSVPLVGLVDNTMLNPSYTAVGSIYEIASASTVAGWNSSVYGELFSGKTVPKTVGDGQTDTNSIYHDSFPWKIDQPLASFSYLTPDISARNTEEPEDSGNFVPYKYGIYAMSIKAGTGSGYYPSANIVLSSNDAKKPGDVSYETAWRSALAGKLSACRQIQLNDQADIIQLEMTNGTNVFRSAEVNTAEQTVTFYLIKDNFSNGTYVPDMTAVYTLISSGASFAPGSSFPLPNENYEFDGTVLESVVTVLAEDGVNQKDWTIRYVFRDISQAVVLTEIWEGYRSLNSSSDGPYNNPNNLYPYSKQLTFNPTPSVTEDGVTYTATDEPSSLHQNHLIFFLNTEGLRLDYDRINEVWLEDSDGNIVTEGIDSLTNSLAANTTFYKIPPPKVSGIDAMNYNAIADPRNNPDIGDYNAYRDYYGRMSINLRLHSNLPSGTYRVALSTVYGMYYFTFTRELNRECFVLDTSVYIKNVVNATVNASVNTTTATISNNSGSNQMIAYGNAPDLRELFSETGLFRDMPILSKGATISGQHLISVKEQVLEGFNKSMVYTIGFRITAENPAYHLDWTMVLTQVGYKDIPADLLAGFKGVDGYTSSQVTNETMINEVFVINEGDESVDISLRYNVNTSNSSNGQGKIFNVTYADYFDFNILQNGVVVPKTSYADYGISYTKSVSSSTHRIDVTVTSQLPHGTYEIRGFYVRNGAPIPVDIQVLDADGKQFDEFAWGNVQYTPFRFNKVKGSKLSYATNITFPYLPSDITISWTDSNPKQQLPWTATNGRISYDALGFDVQNEDYASLSVHNTFYIEIGYKRDIFYHNFAPQFTIPPGATLLRLIGDDEWEVVTKANAAYDFRNEREVVYRVIAEDQRYYQDYVVKLKRVSRVKQFILTYHVENGAPNDLPAGVILRSLDRAANLIDYEIVGGLTVFRDKNKRYDIEWLPPGEYLMDIDVPYGYQARVVAGGSTQYLRDIIIGGKVVSGVVRFNAPLDVEGTYTIDVYIEPIPGFVIPWGIRRDSRG